MLRPQAHRVPLSLMARVKSSPAAMATQSLSVPTRWNVACSAPATPSWPYPLSPATQSVPSDFSATLCAFPPATAIQSLSAPTRAGAFRSVASP